MKDAPLTLFALGASAPLGTAITTALGVPLAPHEARDFEDGEHKLRPLASVRGHDVFVLQALYGDARESPNDRLVKVLFFAAALRDHGAARVTLVAPYLCYARKDRRTKPRDPVASRYVAQLVESVRVDRIVTLDVHNPAAYQNAFRIPAEHLEAASLFATEILRRCGDEPLCVVSPDAGGMKRAEALAEHLERRGGRPIERALMQKKRSAGVVSGEGFAGDVAGRTAIVVDDLISTGTTLARSRGVPGAGGATDLAAVTHGLFARGADAVLTDMPIETLLLTDTVPPFRLDPALHARLHVLSVAPLLGSAIRRLHDDGSLVELGA